MPTVKHPFLRDGVEARAYQIRALRTVLSSSCLMVMPTGYGKTAVEWMVMAEFLRRSDKKIILIAPTTGLVAQQQRMAREMLNIEEEMILRYTGETAPTKRLEIWQRAKIIMATPQVIRNDTTNGKISLKDVSLIIFDEAHHATGNHAYAQVGDLYLKEHPRGRTLGATASPGANRAGIIEVTKRLNTLSLDVSIKHDPLLKPYAVTLYNDIIEVELPESLTTLIFPLQEHQKSEVESVQRMGYMAPVKNITAKVIGDAQLAVSRAISRRDARGYNAAKKISDIRRMHMLLDLLKTQGVKAALGFLDKAETEGRSGDRGTNRFLAKPVIHNFRTNAKHLGELHPKAEIVYKMVKQRIKESPSSRILIFTEYRYTVNNLIDYLSNIDGVNASQFIGQSSSGKHKGMTQKQQISRLDEFRNGEVNVLVATSVGEEGLDVPAADLVLMYEPVPSAIRSIQRRGRTARQSSGTVKTLVAKDTRDQFVRRAAEIREQKMYKNLAEIKHIFTGDLVDNCLSPFSVEIDGKLIQAHEFLLQEQERLSKLYPQQEHVKTNNIKSESIRKTRKNTVDARDKRPRNQTGLEDFIEVDAESYKPTEEEVVDVYEATNSTIDDLTESIKGTVTLDFREASSTLSAYISSLGLSVEYANLDTGDIMIHSNILIERKTSRDLLTSIIDQRLFKQCQRMKNSKLKPLLLIELGEIGNSVHPNAVLGALAHVSIELGIPIITTKDSMESAHLVYIIAKQEGQISNAIRDYTKYSKIDEQTIEKYCKAASIEINRMVNEGKDSDYLVQRWTDEGLNNQVELLSTMTGIDYSKCYEMIEKYDSIVGLFRADIDDISRHLDVDSWDKLKKIF